ncbi:MAG: hypothetical protein Kow0092_28540 [Deferrisomatales bacterium]
MKAFGSERPAAGAPSVLIFGAGNLLLSDEGFGVHFVRHLERQGALPPGVELFDAGTLGIMAAHVLERARSVILVDTVAAPGRPGEVREYSKEDILLDRIPAKLSPHQIGIQEVLLLGELRGRAPEEILFLGVIPERLDPGTRLSPACSRALEPVARRVWSALEAMEAPAASPPKGPGSGRPRAHPGDRQRPQTPGRRRKR